jgi:sugar O-acyltransferase (sialic acid O-acetyltransferase NeuD family)
MKKKLIIFGNAEMGEIAKYYFENFSEYEVKYFTINKEFITTDNFCDRPIIPFENIEKKFLSNEYFFHVALSYQKLNQLREEKYFEAKKKGYKLVNFISEKSNFDPKKVLFGDNCFILENQNIQKGVKIGNNVTIWSGNHIGHNSFIDDHTYLSSHVVVSGHCNIGKRCFFGVNSSIADFCEIEDDCFIGMGAQVNKNLKKLNSAINRSTDYYDKDDRSINLIKKKYFKF